MVGGGQPVLKRPPSLAAVPPAAQESGTWPPDRLLADLLAGLDAHGVAGAAVVGYSFGGRVALRLALHAPERVAALVLESASAGIEDPAERHARRQADESWARLLEREGIEAFVDRWEAQPLFATQAALPAAVRERQRRRRLEQSADGLAACLRALGAGAMEPVWERLGELPMPVLAVAGERDEAYLAHARRLEAAAPRGELAVLPGAGHNTHLETPEAFVETLAGWLERSAATPAAREDRTPSLEETR